MGVKDTWLMFIDQIVGGNEHLPKKNLLKFEPIVSYVQVFTNFFINEKSSLNNGSNIDTS